MNTVLTHLSKGLDWKTRTNLNARAEGLMRAVRYEAEKQSPSYTSATAAGWTMSRIDILCSLNAFYQIVLGPLASVSRGNVRAGLVRDVPIAYGTKVRITQTDGDLLHECHQQFTSLTKRFGIDFWCLQSAHGQDLLYRLGQPRGRHE